MDAQNTDMSGAGFKIDYQDMIRALWQNRWVIVGGTVACAMVAAFVSLILPKTFESSTALILMPATIKQPNDDVSALIPRVLSVPDYEILLRSDGVLRQTAEKVQASASDAWQPEDLEALNEISELRKRMITRVEITEKTAYGIKYSPVIVLKARARTALQARDLAQTWAAVGEELAANLYQKGKTGLKVFIQEHFDTTREDLTMAQAAMRDLEAVWNEALEKERLAKMQVWLLSFEEKYIELQSKMATTREEIVDLSQKLAKEPERKVLWKSPPMTAVFLKEQLSDTPLALPGNDAAQPPGFQEEILNPIYTELQQRLQLRETELRGMEEWARQLLESINELKSDTEALREKNAVKSFERKQLELQVDPLIKSYDLLATKVEQAKIAESEQAELADIKIASDAVVPDRKISPMRSLIVLFATCAGFALSLGGVMMKHLFDMIL
jgi:uncharacterized protein involved in exopolysaccharide biosynthesis